MSHFSISGKPLVSWRAFFFFFSASDIWKAETWKVSPSRDPESLFSDQDALSILVSNASILQIDLGSEDE